MIGKQCSIDKDGWLTDAVVISAGNVTKPIWHYLNYNCLALNYVLSD